MLGDAPRWLRIVDGLIVARGEGWSLQADEDEIVAVVPAAEVAVHHVVLPEVSEPQAQAAARLMLAERSPSPLDATHVAVGAPGATGERTMVAIDRARMTAWLVQLAELGIDPDVMIAASLLLPRPGEGFVMGALGTETIVRGNDTAFVDDPVLTPLLTKGDIVTLDRPMLEQALIRGVLRPEVDLRQGIFAKRRSWNLDRERMRRIGWLTLAVAIDILLLNIVQLVRLNVTADRIEARNIILAGGALAPGTNINNPLIQVQEQVNALRGPGGGLLPLASGVASAADAVPNVELTSMIFDGGGTLRVTARAASLPDLTAFETRLTAAGLTPAAGPVLVDQGRQVRDYTVSLK